MASFPVIIHFSMFLLPQLGDAYPMEPMVCHNVDAKYMLNNTPIKVPE